MAGTVNHGGEEARPQDRRQGKRLVGLDLLRLFAVFLVLGRHMSPTPDDLEPIEKAVIDVWRQGGWIGVDLFFVLSGFLVSGLLFAEYQAHGKLSVGRFYVRRAWKIYPSFYLLILITVVVRLIARNPPSVKSLISECFFLQSYIYGMWIHTWSLAVEEHFYLLLPLVLLGILRWNPTSEQPLRPIVAIALGAAAVCLTLRILNWQLYSTYRNITHLFPTHLRLDSLLWGVAISYVNQFHRAWLVKTFYPWRHLLILGGLLSFTPAFLYPAETSPFICTAGLTLFFVGAGALLTGVLLCEIRPTPIILLFALLGAYSYSIYIWHMPVQILGIPAIERILGHPFGYEVSMLAYWILSFVFGIVMAFVVELPVLRLRDKWFPSRSTTV